MTQEGFLKNPFLILGKVKWSSNSYYNPSGLLLHPFNPCYSSFHHLVNSGSDFVYCFKCSVYVHRNSCHCRQCDKCVESYDHHCKWLNNCIGKNNYKPFLATLLVVFAFSLLQLGVCIYLETMFFLDPSTIKVAGKNIIAVTNLILSSLLVLHLQAIWPHKVLSAFPF